MHESLRDTVVDLGRDEFRTAEAFVIASVRKPELLQSVQAYLQWCFAHESPPRVDELAQRLAASPGQVTRAIHEVTGVSAREYLKRAQVDEAARLLRGGGLPLNRVAYSAGFGTRATFYRVFRRAVGCTPATYRRDCTK